MPQAAEGRPCGPYEHAQALGRAGEHSCKFFRCGSALSQRKWPIFAFGTAPRGENEAACMRHPAGRRPRGPDQHARALGRVGEHFHKFFRCGSALSHCKSLDFAPDAAPRAPCGARTAVSVRSVCGVHRTRALMQKSAFRAPSYGTASRGAPFRPFLAGGAPRHRHRGGPAVLVCICASGRYIQDTLHPPTAVRAPQGACGMTANAKSSDLQWESAESTSWGRWKCSQTRLGARTCWPGSPRRRPATWRMHAASRAAAELRRSAP